MTFGWRHRRVLVTGASGFLGTRLCTALRGAGASVVGSTRHADRLAGRPAITASQVDPADLEGLRRLLQHDRIDTVFHLAAQALVDRAYHEPVETFEANVRATWTLLEACRRTPGVERVITASSDKVYSENLPPPIAEDAPMAPRHPYDLSKCAADLMALGYAATYDLPVAVFRCANLFGPGDLNFSRIVPGTIRAMLRSERPVIHSDGSPVRDYLYADDMVGGCLRLAERMDGPARGRAFNFASGEQCSVLEMTHAILAAGGREDLDPRVDGAPRVESSHRFLSARAANDELDWHPGAPLATRLGQTITWYREHGPAPESAEVRG